MNYTARPNFHARSYAVTAGHFLAATAGHDVLTEGGNAIDAAAAMAFCLAVLEPHQNGIGGECPVIVHFGGKTFAVSGQGTSPGGLPLVWFQQQGISLIPGDGLLPATVPAHVGTWLLLLKEFGSLPLARILEPAIDLAEHGFAVYGSLRDTIDKNQERFLEEWPSSAEVYLIDGEPPEVGQRVKYPALASTLRSLRNESARKRDIREGLMAANQWFYRGPAAAAIENFCSSNRFPDATGREHPGFLTQIDLARWRPALEPTVTYEYHGVTVHKCGPWTQGPVFLQQLAILKGFNLDAIDRDSAEYYHLLIEATKLAFADREAYYGDPDFDAVPIEALLSEAYNRTRRQLIRPENASEALIPGNLHTPPPLPDVSSAAAPQERQAVLNHTGDTTHLDVVDKRGNCVSATPSGGWLQSSPVIPELGFALGTRGQMFYLDESRPNAYAPRKRPRATLTPSLAVKDGKPWLVFGTPGGDGQDQWTLQAFLNLVHFNMTPAEALEAPTFTVHSFPSSFYPRASVPRMVACESRIPLAVLKRLQDMGHEIEVDDAFSHGKPSMIQINQDGSLTAAISSRGEIGYAIGW